MKTPCLWLLAIIMAAAVPESAVSAAEVDYLKDIKPLFARRCYACHGGLKHESELRLDTAASIRQGGEQGPAIVPGKSGESLIIEAVTGDNGWQMPKEGQPLSPPEIELLKAWIDQGAPAPADEAPDNPRGHWAFQPLTRLAVPIETGTRKPDTSGNPIDAFLGAEQQKHGLKPVLPADKRLLLRRVYLDLVGLPPSPSELREFLDDGSADAYEKVVDRLLASPRYGERWARHWMDVWRYSDWDGFGMEVRESKPHIWRWRDWIVESLNADRGYDQMIVEMLAGDEIVPADPGTLRATGFLARNWYAFNRNTWLDNAVEHTAKAFLGLTLNCARCHDHKYDPIAQQDYYRFRAFFEPYNVRTDRVPGQADLAKDGVVRVFDADAATPTYLLQRGDEKLPDKDHPLAPGVPRVLADDDPAIEPVNLPPMGYYPGLRAFVQQETLAQAQAEFGKSQAALSTANEALAAARRKVDDLVAVKAEPQPPTPPAKDDNSNIAKVDAANPPVPTDEASLRAEVSKSEGVASLAEKKVATAKAALVAAQSRIAADQAAFSNPPAADAKPLAQAASQADRQLAACQAEQDVLERGQQLAAARAAAKPDDQATQQKVTEAEGKLAESKKSQETAQAALAQAGETYAHLGDVYPATSTGRRLALARWITASDNPLSARVAANHIWMRHFGAPLVSTVFDFGRNGRPPTHPELLDWLAIELRDGGWRMKPLHRLIVTSDAYRRRSAADGAGDPNLAIDPENRFLWRMNARRMEAEALRDSVLSVAGQLDSTMAGPDLEPAAGLTVPRRSLYFRSAKEKKVLFLSLFDPPNVLDCYRRSESVVPQQALAMANSSLAIVQSRLLAREVSAAAGVEDTPAHVEVFVAAAFERVLCRPPSAQERDQCEQFLREQTARFAAAQNLTPFTSGGESTVKPAADPHARARENLIHVLFNHNDFVTIR